MSSEIISVNDINPVDYYNQNCVEEAIELLVKKNKPLERIGVTSLTYVKNKQDETKRMIVIDRKTNMFLADQRNGLGMPEGVSHTPFMMIQKYCFKNKWESALSYVVFDIMKNEINYIRVGTKYYKRVTVKDGYNISRNELVIWDRTTITDDHGRDFLSEIPKFSKFTMEPDNKDYKKIVNGNYNLYKPFDHEPNEDPKLYKGLESIPWTAKIISHIFGSKEEDFERGIRYLKVLYDRPKQILPILVLISQERGTGKTTFINWLSMLFGENSVIVNPNDIKNDFNGSYAEKNLIFIEESHFDSRQTLEKLKNLSTQKKILVNNKFIAQYSMPFFGKIIITSNDERQFSKVDEDEIRYWVRKIPTLQGVANHNILNDLVDEIPFLLQYLNESPEVDYSKSRMVFTPEEIQTEALHSVKKESREGLHKELEMYFDNHFQQNTEVETFYFLPINIKESWFQNNHRIGISYISTVLKDKMNLEKSAKAMRFYPLEQQRTLGTKVVGKPFSIENPYFGIVTKDDDQDLTEGEELIEGIDF